ncbi:hypothetical protein JX266_003886 [Neoarthrinium moseri]|nr:hypothetical protein JX266_003886 [Neoarthrinium moseri]
MESWMRDNGKPALFEALSDAWGRMEEEYQDAIHAETLKKVKFDAEFKVLKAQVANVDRLEQQNKDLKEQLAQLRKNNQQRQQTPSKNAQGVRTPLASLSANTPRSFRASSKHDDHLDVDTLSHPDLITAYSRLEEKYTKLRKQFSDSVEVNEQLKAQCREKTKAYENWMKHAQTLEGQVHTRKKKIDKLKEELQSLRASIGHNDAATNSSFASEANSVAGDGRGVPATTLRQDPLHFAHAATLWPPEHPNDAKRESSVLSGADTERVPSLPPLPEASGETAHRLPSNEPSSDSPVIISERPVRKRRRNDNQPTYAPVATRIKREPGSDPVVADEQYPFVPHESIDFDNAEERLVTPRKARTIRSVSQKAASISGKEATPDAFSAHGSMSAHVQERERAAAQWRATVFPDDATEGIDHDDLPRRSSALYPLDMQTPLPKPMARNARSKRVVPSLGLRQGIASLAEDGDENSQSLGHQSAKSGRLENLLNAATPERSAIAVPSGARPQDTPSGHPFSISMPEKREFPWLKKVQKSKVSEALNPPETPVANSSKRTPSAIQANLTTLDAPKQSAKPNRGRGLRDRPVWSLSRTDFKVNPKYNDGHDYAFTEVVRGKDRSCLPGCAREECCGKIFRPMALAALDTTGDMAMSSLLEDYLGEDAGRLGYMTPQEKKDLWVEAKIKDLSNKHGRHRERYGGMPEPPGYDRMGFPSTQEDQADREEASRREREEVERRHAEALQKGRWLFRDEDP